MKINSNTYMRLSINLSYRNALNLLTEWKPLVRQSMLQSDQNFQIRKFWAENQCNPVSIDRTFKACNRSSGISTILYYNKKQHKQILTVNSTSYHIYAAKLLDCVKGSLKQVRLNEGSILSQESHPKDFTISFSLGRKPT